MHFFPQVLFCSRTREREEDLLCPLVRPLHTRQALGTAGRPYICFLIYVLYICVMSVARYSVKCFFVGFSTFFFYWGKYA